ncbi:MAG: hypothetical protein ACRCZF_00500, partial [Gemmataceae bacterium]
MALLRPRWWHHLLALGIGLLATFHPMIYSGFQRMPVDPGDTVLNHYLLEHTWRSLTDRDYHGTYLSPPFYAPTPYVLGYSENLAGVFPFYALCRLVLPMVLAYQVWMMLLMALNYVAIAGVLRRAGLPHPATIGVAYMASFSTLVIGQVCHQQLLCRSGLWIAAALAYRWVQQPNRRDGAGILAAIVCQCFSCIYTGWFLILMLGVLIPVAAWVQGTGRELIRWSWANRSFIVGIVTAAALPLGLLARFYWSVNPTQQRTFDQMEPYLFTLSSWLGGPPETMWYHSIRPFREGLSEESYLFRGFGFLGLLFVALREGLRQRGTALGRHLAVGGLTAFILTLLATNFWGVSPWMLVQYLPGGGGLRAVGRLSIAIDVVLLPTVALAVVETVRRSRRGAVVVAGLVLLMAIEQWTYAVPTFMVDEFYGELPALGARLKGADLGAADVDFDHYVFGQTKA